MKRRKAKKDRKQKHATTRIGYISIFSTAILLTISFLVFTRISNLQSVLGASFSISSSNILPKKITTNTIVQENNLPGTTSWQITNPSRNGEIQAYADKDSINRGQSVNIYVSTNNAQNYNVYLYRLGYYNGAGGRLIASYSNNKGISQGYYINGNAYPTNCPTCTTSYINSLKENTYLTQANWKPTEQIVFNPNWISGLYMLKFVEVTGKYEWGVPIVVRDDSYHSAALFMYPDFTDQAYNTWGGVSLYTNLRGSNLNWAYEVSFNRPYADIKGGYQSYGLGRFLFGPYQMARFLEKNGYDVTYTTDNALEQKFSTLTNHKAFIVAGHSEYNTIRERRMIENAINNKVNIAYFGANDMYWQVRTLPDAQNNPGRIIICYKDTQYNNGSAVTNDPVNYSGSPYLLYTTTQWRMNPVNMPESSILKSDFSYGSGRSTLPANQDFVAKNTNHWIYKFTGLKDGDIIPGIVGYEVDTYDSINGKAGPNDTVTILGHSPFLTQTGATAFSDAVIDEFKNGEIVFNAASIFWDIGISDYPVNWASLKPLSQSPALIQMTNNLLNRIINGNAPQQLSTPSFPLPKNPAINNQNKQTQAPALHPTPNTNYAPLEDDVF